VVIRYQKYGSDFEKHLRKHRRKSSNKRGS
jgi:hypothetical protein